jgi:hypothetical protein
MFKGFGEYAVVVIVLALGTMDRLTAAGVGVGTVAGVVLLLLLVHAPDPRARATTRRMLGRRDEGGKDVGCWLTRSGRARTLPRQFEARLGPSRAGTGSGTFEIRGYFQSS